jgi:FkbM family methyltransferase
MNEIIKFWDENLVLPHIGNELNWLFNYLDENKLDNLSYIDIGGNVGKFYDQIITKYTVKKANIIEPSKILFDYMVGKYKDKNNVDLYNFAINNKDGSVEFVDSAQSASDFFIERGVDNSINLGLSKMNRNNPGSTQCISIDTFLRKITTIKPDEIDFIKIDTENSDLFILENMINFLVDNKIRPFILFENNYHNDLTTEKAMEIMKNFCLLGGYEDVDLSGSGDNLIMPKKI